MNLIENARKLVPELTARAAEIEAGRRIPADVSKRMAEAGFFRMFVPEALGGLELSPLIAVEVFELLAQGDASSAWIAFIGATSGTVLERVPEAAARAVFGKPETLITGVFAPSGRAEIVDGGFLVNGRWQWGSGSENADWILGGCQILRNGEPLTTRSGAPRTHMVLLPASEVKFLDTWHVSGLCGTGSTDYYVEDLFVPTAHVAGYEITESSDRPLYQFPQFTFLALGIAAVSLGIARAAIDELIAVAANKIRAGSSSAIANRVHTQMEVAQAEATLRAARAFYYQALTSAWDQALAGKPVPVDQRRDLRLATTFAVQSAVKVVDAMYTQAGGTSVYETSRLQRQFRDVHVATQHIMVAASTFETVGRLFLGVETNTAML
ncbi:MAG: acyl-CoA dehydrogenase family protein [Pseudomonadales bacterium]|nr:acyl-CoA dehydrogenase family protein [Pseudomonadales bacterium]